ncbi:MULTISPECIES: hypothetical protein [unclassified Mesorhizobium]|uniref:hypothetical protein n=1 Tax=unclassified Mesorhizobium TaxID=325217 RepID=UPI000FD80891|nr:MULTISPECIES: hypothetical protein [unclassified Mesorhizobium]TGQ33343.1 hypothetical protein EN859_026535 [Mesorhizobium sp. M00.F.Ca.ET.216.01.1.1]TIS58069.1 MAG: hypothetical protein E5W91_11435 [Mesorhizobium sp.]TJW16740.1 MAG: hypothetical protein E5W82_05595 [Mesorhizobium sp.]TJW46179.1 MAG: hypothetical protein E5W83_09745 [Mesorhizobium sp.]
MPLQNRVDPFGAIHAVPERGLFMGNRGIIHDPETKTLLKKRWALHAWIICVCEFRNVRREPMGRNRQSDDRLGGKPGWTELFFMDEVTALAAGHRPCFFCRRERAKDFVLRFGQAFGIVEPRAPQVDKRLHKERLASGGRPPAVKAEELAGLPDGTVVADGCNAFALRDGRALRWSFAGYGEPAGFDGLAGRPLRLLTPATTISVLRQGYEPVWRASASA